jgi:hypothetical protein
LSTKCATVFGPVYPTICAALCIAVQSAECSAVGTAVATAFRPPDLPTHRCSHRSALRAAIGGAEHAAKPAADSTAYKATLEATNRSAVAPAHEAAARIPDKHSDRLPDCLRCKENAAPFLPPDPVSDLLPQLCSFQRPHVDSGDKMGRQIGRDRPQPN